jgi:hypothetical protein
MNRLQKRIIPLAFLFTVVVGVYHVSADGHKQREKHRGQGQRYLNPVTDLTYKEKCGSCHFAYQPALLPSGSWEKILLGLDTHFGEAVQIDPDAKKNILTYLKSNAAEYSSGKLSAKIIKSLSGQTPLKISDIPYIRKKHYKQTARSIADCAECHRAADKGIYKDNSLKIHH